MQSAKCKVQNAKWSGLVISTFALCTLHFALAGPIESRPFFPSLTPPLIPAESSHSYDARHYQIDLNLPMISGACDGHTGVTITSRAPVLDTLLLAMDSLVCDSVKQHGVSQAFSFVPDTLSIALAPGLPDGESTIVDVYYHRRSGLANRGFWWYAHQSTRHAQLFTVAAPYDARFWFPCYDEPFDKAEQGVSFRITVPDTYSVCCNGLQDSVRGDTVAHTRTFYWSHHYPIATYLICMAASVWHEYDQWYHRGLPDSVITRTFMFPEDTTWMPNSLRDVPNMMTYYIDTLAFGAYPFECFGHVVPSGFQYGGMENQTLVMLNHNQVDDPTISHEMSHMWWGDMVTCIDYRNIWLNEGFATYCQARYLEHQVGHATFVSLMNARASGYFGEDQGHRFPTYNPPMDQVYAEGTIYYKGSWLQHMLRYLMSDTIPSQPGAFYRALRVYGDSFRYGGASTEDYIRFNERESGLDLSWFLNEWLYLAGYPQYHLAWSAESVGSASSNAEGEAVAKPPRRMPGRDEVTTPNAVFRVVTNLSQTNGSGAASVFHMPLQLKFRTIHTDTVDTLITVPVASSPQVDTFMLSFRPETLLLDPGSWVLKKSWVTGIDEASVLHPDPELTIAGPTLARNVLRFECRLPRPGHLDIFNAAGRLVYRTSPLTPRPSPLNVSWNCAAAPAGVYLARLTCGSQTVNRKVLIAH